MPSDFIKFCKIPSSTQKRKNYSEVEPGRGKSVQGILAIYIFLSEVHLSFAYIEPMLHMQKTLHNAELPVLSKQ